jgi:hypothetical protein
MTKDVNSVQVTGKNCFSKVRNTFPCFFTKVGEVRRNTSFIRYPPYFRQDKIPPQDANYQDDERDAVHSQIPAR